MRKIMKQKDFTAVVAALCIAGGTMSASANDVNPPEIAAPLGDFDSAGHVFRELLRGFMGRPPDGFKLGPKPYDGNEILRGFLARPAMRQEGRKFWEQAELEKSGYILTPRGIQKMDDPSTVLSLDNPAHRPLIEEIVLEIARRNHLDSDPRFVPAFISSLKILQPCLTRPSLPQCGGSLFGVLSAAAAAAPARSVDIEVRQEMQCPFGRWRIRSGATVIFVERVNSGLATHRVSGNEVNLEIGQWAGSNYIRGTGSDALLNDFLLMQEVFRIVRTGCL